MLKCGQTDNDHYTFGIKKAEEDTIKNANQCEGRCSKCGEPVQSSMSFCPCCGEKI